MMTDCAFCDTKNATCLVLIPILVSNESGESLGPFACKACAEERGFYCTEHDTPHIGFLENTHACIPCINEKVSESTDKQNDELFVRVLHALPEEGRDELLNALDVAAATVGDGRAKALVRFIWTLALRKERTPEEIMQEITATKSAKMLLPPIF